MLRPALLHADRLARARRRCLPWILLLAFSSVCALAAAPTAELLTHADSARKSGDLPAAINLYRSALAQDSTSEQGWWYLGNCLYALRRFPEAIDAFQSLLNVHPQLLPAIALRGLSRIETGDISGALTDIQSVLHQKQDSAVPDAIKNTLRANEPLLLNRLGRFDQSLRILALFARGEPTAQLFDAIGLAVLRRPILPADIPAADRALISRAGQAGFLMLSGSKSAEPLFRQLCADFPSIRNVHFALGYALLARSPSDAAVEFRRELALDGDNPDPNAMLAYVLLTAGDARTALPLAQKAVKLSPDAATPQSILGRVLLALGKDDPAISYMESAADSDPGNLENGIALAGAYLQAGRFADAQRERQFALRLKDGAAQ